MAIAVLVVDVVLGELIPAVLLTEVPPFADNDVVAVVVLSALVVDLERPSTLPREDCTMSPE